jgi:protocatechuate 3,4-dioxygenase beta subunit
MVPRQHTICLPAVPLLLALLVVVPNSVLLGQDSPESSAAKVTTQQASPSPDGLEKPAPDTSAHTESCSVEGAVVAAAGSAPLRGARVILIASEAERTSLRSYTASTDGEGHFRINGIAPGRYQFHAAKPGFVAQPYGPAGGSDGAILELLPGQKIDNVLFKLNRAAVILGRVSDENGEPVVGVQVEALVPVSASGALGNPLPKGLWGPVKVTTTNDLGEYRLYGLNPGAYYVAAIDSGIPELGEAMALASASVAMAGENIGMVSLHGNTVLSGGLAGKGHPPVYYPGVTQREEAQKIRLSAGQEARVDIALRAEKTVTVSGRVLDLKGKPAGQTMVQLYSQHLEAMLSSMRTSAITDAQGKFEIKDVMPGSYLLTATSNQDMKNTWADQPLEVAGEDVTGVQLQLNGGLKLSGKLQVPGGSDLDLTAVGILLSGGALNRMGWSDVKKDGSFSFADLRSTTYGVQVNNLPEGWYVSSASFGGDNVLEYGLRLGEGAGSRALEITIKQGTGQVDGAVFKGDDPVPGATVRLLPEHASPYRYDLPQSTTTDQRGHFVIKNVVPGSYRALAVAGKPDDQDHDAPEDEAAAGTSVVLGERESKTVQLKLAADER